MRIAVLSDFHLGFGEGTERAGESFRQAASALGLALENNAEIILHAGDLFDDDVPSQETWEKTFRLFSVLKQTKADLKIVKEKGGRKEEFHFSHVPVIAIHGTHEFRGSDLKNALDVLESAGLLVHLHAATAIVGQLAVQGLSGVPEKKALDALKLWNPKPVQGKKNVLLLHQSIREFLPFDDEMVASISLADLPDGFDLLVNGHLHWQSEENLKGKKLLMPGSTIITQMKKLEAEKEKGIFIWDTGSGAIEFRALPGQRKFFYKKIELNEATQELVKRAVEGALGKIAGQGFEQKPLVRIRLGGTLAKGIQQGDVSLKEVCEKFGEKAIVSVAMDFTAVSFAKKLEELRALQKRRKSIAAMGLELLDQNLAQTDFKNAFDTRELFELLSSGKVDEVVEMLSKKRGEQKV